MNGFDNMPVPRVEWDLDSRAIYLRLDDDPSTCLKQEEIGGCIFDLTLHNEVVGVEMLSCPEGGGHPFITAMDWVLIGRAWEMARPFVTAVNDETVARLIGTSGAFTIHKP